MNSNLPSLPGVSVLLDETGDYPQLVVLMPAGIKLPRQFVSLCHKAAGDNGATIEFRAK